MNTPRVSSLEDVHRLARSMPHVTPYESGDRLVCYQVGGRSFVYFRTPRPDAVDPDTGVRYDDVVMLWVPSDGDKQALVQDDSPFFTTPHFDGHPSVLVRAGRLGEVGLDELTEIVQDAWLSRASKRRADAWLAAHPR